MNIDTAARHVNVDANHIEYEGLVRELEQHPIAGNFALDQPLWAACDDVVGDPTIPMPLRIRALQVICNIVGDDKPADAVGVVKHAQYLRKLRDQD